MSLRYLKFLACFLLFFSILDWLAPLDIMISYGYRRRIVFNVVLSYRTNISRVSYAEDVFDYSYIHVVVVGCRNTSTNYRETGIRWPPKTCQNPARLRWEEPLQAAASQSVHKRASRLELIKADLQTTKNLLAYALQRIALRAYIADFLKHSLLLPILSSIQEFSNFHGSYMLTL